MLVVATADRVATGIVDACDWTSSWIMSLAYWVDDHRPHIDDTPLWRLISTTLIVLGAVGVVSGIIGALT